MQLQAVQLMNTGKETIRHFIYNSIFIHAVKAIHKLHQLVEQQQEQIALQKTTDWQIDKYNSKRFIIKSSSPVFSQVRDN